MVHCFNCYNKLELLVCFAGNCEQNFLGGGKSTSFLFIRSCRQSNRNSKGSEKKIRNSNGEKGLTILEFGGYGGEVEHFGFLKARGG